MDGNRTQMSFAHIYTQSDTWSGRHTHRCTHVHKYEEVLSSCIGSAKKGGFEFDVGLILVTVVADVCYKVRGFFLCNGQLVSSTAAFVMAIIFVKCPQQTTTQH